MFDLYFMDWMKISGMYDAPFYGCNEITYHFDMVIEERTTDDHFDFCMSHINS